MSHVGPRCPGIRESGGRGSELCHLLFEWPLTREKRPKSNDTANKHSKLF